MRAKLAYGLFAVAAAAAVGGCSGERTLPNGYRWVSIYGDTGAIADSEGAVAVDVKVSSSSLKVSGENVYGLREVEEPIGNPPGRTAPIEGRYGEFVLNTRTGVVQFRSPPPAQH